MSVRSRIEDALVLKVHEQFEGALLATLIAVGATARKRFPQGCMSRLRPNKRMGDEEAYILLIKEECESLFGKGKFIEPRMPFVDPRNPNAGVQREPLWKIIYVLLRCQLVHEAGLGAGTDFQYTADERVSVGWDHEIKAFRFTGPFLDSMMSLVVLAAENRVEFRDWVGARLMSVGFPIQLPVDIAMNARISQQVADNRGSWSLFFERLSYKQEITQAALSRLATAEINPERPLT